MNCEKKEKQISQKSQDNMEIQENLCNICRSSHEINDRFKQHYCYVALYYRMSKVILEDPFLKQQDREKDKQIVIAKNQKKANHIKQLIEQKQDRLALIHVRRYLKEVILYEQKQYNPWIVKITEHKVVIRHYICPECKKSFQELKGNAQKHMRRFCFKNAQIPEPSVVFHHLETYYQGG